MKIMKSGSKTMLIIMVAILALLAGRSHAGTNSGGTGNIANP